MLEKNVPASIATWSLSTSSLASVTAVGRLAAVVLGDHFELLAVDAAGGVDLVERQLPALAVGRGEGGQAGIGVDLADLDRVVGAAPARLKTSSRDQLGRKHRVETRLKLHIRPETLAG